jgi:hypothetical protein
VLDEAPVETSSAKRDPAGAEKMNTTARLASFLAALLVGLFVAAYRYHGATIDAYLHTSHLHVMDWVLLIFGSLCVGGLTYNFLTQPDAFDWRGGLWLIIGGAMIYAALGGNPWLKEETCQMLSSRHHYYDHPCYF